MAREPVAAYSEDLAECVPAVWAELEPFVSKQVVYMVTTALLTAV